MTTVATSGNAEYRLTQRRPVLHTMTVGEHECPSFSIRVALFYECIHGVVISIADGIRQTQAGERK